MPIPNRNILLLASALFMLAACSRAYYGTMEKMGVHKRDILVDRVESARDSQADAQEQFKSALEQFESVVGLEETDLKKAYERLNDEYQDSRSAAADVSARIDRVESVAQALFEEWEDELDLYQNPELRRSSKRQLDTTRHRYSDMLATMHRAEKSMAPVLEIFQDNVLYLKHNLNAQAIGSLNGEFNALEGQINDLVRAMNESIVASNAFIEDLRQ